MNKRLLVALGLVLVLSLVVATPALAAEIIEGTPDATISEPIDDDVIVTGNVIIVDSAIEGDLIAIGSEVTITEDATISGNLIALGSTVIVDGQVLGDVGIGGYVAQIGEGASFADELFFGGYSLEMRPGSQVADDLFAAGYQIVVQNVGGDMQAGANGLRIEGIVTGDVSVSVGATGSSLPPGMTFGPTPTIPVPTVPGGLAFGYDGRVEGDLDYESEQYITGLDDYVEGSVAFERVVSTSGEGTRRAGDEMAPGEAMGIVVVNRVMNAIRRFVTWVLVGVLLQRFAPGFFNGVATTLKERIWPSLGIGFAGLLIFPPAVILLIVVVIMVAILLGVITLGGLSMGWLSIGGLGLWGFILAFFLILSWISKIIVGYVIGAWLVGLGKPERELPFWALVLGAFLLAVASAIPGVNFLVNWIVVPMFGLGAVVIYLWSLRRPPEAAPEAAPAV
jgi:hypothetical protein